MQTELVPFRPLSGVRERTVQIPRRPETSRAETQRCVALPVLASSRDPVVIAVEIAGCVALLACTGAVLDVFDARAAIHAGCALAAVGGVTAFLSDR